MDKLKAWLRERDIVIVRPGIANNGLVSLRLRTPMGRVIEIDLDPEHLERDPDNAIYHLKRILALSPATR